MYEKLSTRSWDVISFAHKFAKSGSGVFESSDLLLGLVWENGIASRALAACGVTDAIVCREEWSYPTRETTGDIHYGGRIGPYSDAVKQLLERALVDAQAEACNYIDPEHILLAFFNPFVESVGKRILLNILKHQGKMGNDLRIEIWRLREAERVDQRADWVPIKPLVGWGSTKPQGTVTPRQNNQTSAAVLLNERDVTVTLRRGHAVELLRLVGERPHSEVWSREIFTQLREALKGSQVDV